MLFIFRAADDNRLTSWEWVFANVDASKVYFIFIAGIIIAWAVARVSLPERYFSVFLFLFSFIPAVVFWRIPEVIIDASRYFTQAKHLEVYGIRYFLREWGRGINVWTDMPLMPFLYGLIFKFFGESRVYIQLFNTLLFSMTVVLTYLIGKALWDRTVGFYGGILLLGIPYLFTQVPLMLVDVPTMFFLVLSVFTFIKALGQGSIWIGLSSFAIFLAAFSKYSVWLMLSVLMVIFVVAVIRSKDSGRDKRIILYRGALIISISAVLIAVVLLYKYDVFSEQMRLLITYQRPALRRWGETFISTFFFQIHPFITFSALFSVYVAFKKKDVRYVIISSLVMLVYLLQIKRIRYLMIVFPMLTLMASYGLCEMRDRELRKFIVSCIVISSLVLALFAYLPFLQKVSTVNLKYAGEFVGSLNGKYVEVYTLPQNDLEVNPAVAVPMLDLFTKKIIGYNYKEGVFASAGDIQTSPLRFTWEFKNPGYYAVNREDFNIPVIIISDNPNPALPDYIIQRINGHRYSKVFKTWEGIFRYKTIVTVYY
jgi:hypothetical protein